MHLLELWQEPEHIRVMIDYGGNDAAERFNQSRPDVTTKPENTKNMNLGMHYDFGFENATCQYRFVSCHVQRLPKNATIANVVQKNNYGSVELHWQQIGQTQNDAKKKITILEGKDEYFNEECSSNVALHCQLDLLSLPGLEMSQCCGI